MENHIILALFMCLTACNNDGRTTLLTWSDKETKKEFEIYFEATLVKTNNYLRVDNSITMIDDDAWFTKPKLLRFNDWVLVLNEDHVWAGYNYKTDTLHGEQTWINLPFKVHNSEGRIVAEKRVNPKEEAIDPIGWNHVANKVE